MSNTFSLDDAKSADAFRNEHTWNIFCKQKKELGLIPSKEAQVHQQMLMNMDFLLIKQSNVFQQQKWMA